MFVGDDPRWDVAGAEAAGLRPILLSPDASVTDARAQVIRRLSDVLDVI